MRAIKRFFSGLVKRNSGNDTNNEHITNDKLNNEIHIYSDIFSISQFGSSNREIDYKKMSQLTDDEIKFVEVAIGPLELNMMFEYIGISRFNNGIYYFTILDFQGDGLEISLKHVKDDLWELRDIIMNKIPIYIHYII